MIEVEKQFRLTDSQLREIVRGSTFIKEKKFHDIYYDFCDYRLVKKEVRFRSRNGVFELKVWNSLGGDKEITNENQIKNYFKTDLSIEEFIEKNLVKFMEYKTERVVYKNGIFEIDIDECDFGFNVCEIELMVKDESQIKGAKLEIKKFALKFGLEKEQSTKKEEYLKRMNPEVYNMIFGNKEVDKEIFKLK